jgi:hypothetical protein
MDGLDSRVDNALRAPEAAIADDGFSERILQRLPKRRLSGAASRRWTLAAAAATGSLLTILLAPPVETAFGLALLPDSLRTFALAALAFAATVGIPLACVFHSELGAWIATRSLGLGVAAGRRKSAVYDE